MHHGLEQLQQGTPLSLRLLREIHAELPSWGRGNSKQRKSSQNWIAGSRPGNAHFVPAPPDMTMEMMGSLEKIYVYSAYLALLNDED